MSTPPPISQQEPQPLQDPPEIHPAADTTLVIQEPSLSSQTPPGSYYDREAEIEDNQAAANSAAFAAPFQVSAGMPVFRQETGSSTVSPSPAGKSKKSSSWKPRLSALRFGLVGLAILVALGGLWLTVFAQPTQPLSTSTPSSGSPSHPRGLTSAPTVKPTALPSAVRPTPVPTTTASASSGTWIPTHLPAGWTNAGLTLADSIFAERTAWTFTDREEGLDFRNMGTQAQHGGTFTAATFLLSPGGKSRFSNNDVRAINNTLFNAVAQTQLIQAAVNATPTVTRFQVQGTQQFAWVDVSYVLFQSKIDPNAPQQRAETLEMDATTGQPRIHHMSVLLIRVAPRTQGPNAPMGGSGWLVSSYGLDVTDPLGIEQPV